jgi:V/A-type H+-transporting ATPase subunit E
MPLDNVIGEIYEKGKEQVENILKEAEKEAESIINEAKREAEEILRKAREEAEKEAQNLRKQEVSSVSLEMKRLYLNKQKELLESVFDLARQRIREMGESDRKKLLEELIAKNAQDGMAVYSREEDEKVVREILSRLDKKLEYGGNVNCLGGIILENSEEGIRINLTFDEILNQLFEQEMGEVSKILLGG